ncbi:MAG: YceI family protein [Bacteroidota bacterium]
METRVNWMIDAAHTKISFKVKHLMISNVQGNFNDFEGTVTTLGNDFSTAIISFSLQTASIATQVPDRDAHLKSADFFDVEKFPKITFLGHELKDLGDDMYEITGDLTMKNISQQISLTVEHGGMITDPWGQVKTGFTITGKINRKNWGLNWNTVLETGGVLVGEEVKILCEVELTKQ